MAGSVRRTETRCRRRHPPVSFTRKRLDITFQLGTGVFGDSGATTVTLSGVRASAHISAAGGASMSTLDLRVWGLPPGMLNTLTALTTVVMMQRNNSVIVSAGDDVSGMATIYEGTISQGWTQINQPESVLTITAHSGLIQKIAPAVPRSYPTTADAAVIMASICLEMGGGLVFENSGVSVILSTPYLSGTLYDQAQAVAAAGNFNFAIDNGKFAIWPRGGTRGGAITVVSPESGMIGYPTFTSVGIAVQKLFDPTISIGNAVQVQSGLQQACGKWFVIGVWHQLDAELPGGQWLTHFEGAPLYGDTNVIPQNPG
jgi:hypothetical protein